MTTEPQPHKSDCDCAFCVWAGLDPIMRELLVATGWVEPKDEEKITLAPNGDAV